MGLAIGLAATFAGATLVIAGVTGRSFPRLLLGNWDAPGATGGSTALPSATTRGNAATGATTALHPSAVADLANILGTNFGGPR